MLGIARCNDGDLPGCRQAIEQGESLARSAFGDDHPQYGFALAARSWLSRFEGIELEQTIALTRKALAILQEQYPPNHNAITDLQATLANRLTSISPDMPANQHASNIGEARALLEHVIDMSRRDGIPPPPLTEHYLARLLTLWADGAQDLARAEALLVENRDFLQHHYPEGHPFRSMNQLGLAHLLYRRERFDEADALYAALHEAARKRPPSPNAYIHLNTSARMRADIASRYGQPQQALALLQDSLRDLRAQYPDEHRHVVANVEAIRDLERTGRFDAVAGRQPGR